MSKLSKFEKVPKKALNPQKIDSFTARLLLKGLKHEYDAVSTDGGAYKLGKEMAEKASSQEDVQEAIEESQKAGYKIGIKVTLRDDNEVGEIISYNQTTSGFYPGDRYPLIVKFPKRGTFEYGINSLDIAK